MKNIILASLALLIMMSFSGCSSPSSKLPGTSGSIDKIIENQINNANENETSQNNSNTQENNNSQENNTSNGNDASSNEANQDNGKNQNIENTQTTGSTVYTEYDYDLTSMGSDLIYATIYNIMMNPDDYTGKVIRIKGSYAPVFYDVTSKYYHYVANQDASACCAQGLEFTWDDGYHIYPQDYPEQNTQIIVTGIFETYVDQDDSNTYCRLRNATLEIL